MIKYYKIKSHKGCSKRFKLTKNKKIKFFSSGKKHGMSKKSRNKNRLLKRNKFLNTSVSKLIKRIIFCL